jgi:hypothetical protein
MKSRTTDRFWKCYALLPADTKKRAKEAYKHFMKDPYHPGLHYKRVHSSRPIFSVRITKDYRAVGILPEHEMIWFWIGAHSEYEQLLKQFRNV